MKVVMVHGKYFNSWEAQGLGYIASYLRSKVPDAELVFFQGVFDSDEDILAACADADWVLFSCTSPTYAWAWGLAKQIKQGSHARIVLGGYHASAVSRMVGTDFDHVVIGEGEQATVNLLTGATDRRFVIGSPMQFANLPWPDRKFIRNERNIAVAAKDTGKRITSFQSHRGCPFHCKFCGDGEMKVFYSGGKPLCRNRNMEDLLAEIEHVCFEYRLDMFKFCDPTWNLNRTWVKDFCRGKSKSPIRTPFFANIHAGVGDETMYALMAEAGCTQIGLGVESGSERVLKHIGKGATKEQIVRAVGWAKKYGIEVRGYFILGVPEETEEDVLLTERFAEELDLDEYGFAMLCPYPGTTYFRDNADLWGIDWSKTDEYANDFWRTATIPNARLRELQLRLVEKFRQRITQHQRGLETSTTEPARV